MATSTSVETTEQSFNRVASDTILQQMEGAGQLEPNAQYFTPDTEGSGEYVTHSELEQQGFAKQTEVNRLNILLTTKLDDFEVLIGTNPPSATKVGAVGQLYYASNYDSVYMCVGTLSGGTFNWKPVGGALYLPTSGGTVTGNLTVNQTLTVGNANIAYNSTDKCLKFTFN